MLVRLRSLPGARRSWSGWVTPSGVVPATRDAGGVIAAVLEAGEAFHDDVNDGLGTDVTDNSAHRGQSIGYGR